MVVCREERATVEQASTARCRRTATTGQRRLRGIGQRGGELDRILRDCKLPAAVRQLACVMTLNRLIAPSSEHAMPDWVRRTALADIIGIDFEGLDEQPLYRVLDKLHPHRAAIEAELV